MDYLQGWVGKERQEGEGSGPAGVLRGSRAPLRTLRPTALTPPSHRSVSHPLPVSPKYPGSKTDRDAGGLRMECHPDK